MKCSSCPVPNGEPCQGETIRPNLCGMAARGMASALGLIRDVSARKVEPALPPLHVQAAHLAGSVGRSVNAAVHLEPIYVPAEVLAERKAICEACPHWLAEARRCSLCGCWTDRLLKLANERCPDPEGPRWLEYEKPT